MRVAREQVQGTRESDERRELGRAGRSKQKAPPVRGRLMSGRDQDQVRILLEAFMKASISALLPMETRPTVGHTGQRGPAICTPWAL